RPPTHLALLSFPTRRSSDLSSRPAPHPPLPSPFIRPDAGASSRGHEWGRKRVVEDESPREGGGEPPLKTCADGLSHRLSSSERRDRKSTRLNSSHQIISYAV